MEKKYCTAVIPAAEKGSRMDGNTAKQCMEIDGKPLMAYALEVFEASPVIDEIIPMTDAGRMEYVRTEIVEAYGLKEVSTIDTGGSEQYESTWRTLCALMGREEGERESVARDKQDGCVSLHDGTHPLVIGEIIEWVCRAVCKCNACVVDMPVKDTIKLVNREGVVRSGPDRNMVWQAQTPQVFSAPLIVEASICQMKGDYTGITDDTMMVEAQMGAEAHMIMGSYANVKITTPEDLLIAEMLRSSIV